MAMHRRTFLKALGTAVVAAGMPAAATARLGTAGAVAAATPNPGAAREAAGLTTLEQRLGPGAVLREGAVSAYRGLTTLPGEPHLVRDELVAAQEGRHGRRRSLVSFVHLTDQHIVDVQSTTRVEFLDRYSDGRCGEQTPFTSAHRPQESACARIVDAMNRRIRQVGVSPVTGVPLQASISTGDNTDNAQLNEVEWFVDLMDGGRVEPQSGNPRIYEGVQKSGDRSYWHPDPGQTRDLDGSYRPDLYKALHGFPDAPGWLERALSPFDAVGVGVPWYSCFGNHDGLAQGNAPSNGAFLAIGLGPAKVAGTPETAACSASDDPSQVAEVLAAPGLPTFPVTADTGRRYLSRRQWMAAHFRTDPSSPGPFGHGFSSDNLSRNVAYYVADVGSVRWIVLDTVNPGGYSSGSIGERQLQWLDARLGEADEEGKLVLLFSHHGLRSLDNPVDAPSQPDPTVDRYDDNDLPRRRADDVLAVVSRHPSVVGWVNGHTHKNVIELQQGPGGHPFWDVGTAAHIDWPSQARIIDVVDNADGTLSIFTTLIDLADEPIAAQARELSGNDPQKGFGYGDGRPEDRNTELLLPHPFHP